MLNWKVVCLSLGLWAAMSFIVCVAWGLVTLESLLCRVRGADSPWIRMVDVVGISAGSGREFSVWDLYRRSVCTHP